MDIREKGSEGRGRSKSYSTSKTGMDLKFCGECFSRENCTVRSQKYTVDLHLVDRVANKLLFVLAELLQAGVQGLELNTLLHLRNKTVTII